MCDFIETVNKYPWTSLFIFFGVCVVLDVVATTIQNVYLFKSRKK
jgi:hypothetical protein